jgi:hypothetical protein
VTGKWGYSTGISHDFDPLVFDADGSQTITGLLDFNKASFNSVCTP